MNWNDRPEVRKGSFGESLVEVHLEQKGFIVYRPTSGPHPFDRLCASKDKRRIFVAEIKSKARRKCYPDTGFDVRHNQDYLHIAMTYSMDVFVYFVDEVIGWIYGGELIANLHKPRQIAFNGRIINYPWTQGGIIYFPLEAMENIAPLPEEERRKLQSLSTGANAQGNIF